MNLPTNSVMKRGILAALIVLLALVGMSAAAEGNVTALGKGQHGVLFDNGFTGFCNKSNSG